MFALTSAAWRASAVCASQSCPCTLSRLAAHREQIHQVSLRASVSLSEAASLLSFSKSRNFKGYCCCRATTSCCSFVSGLQPPSLWYLVPQYTRQYNLQSLLVLSDYYSNKSSDLSQVAARNMADRSTPPGGKKFQSPAPLSRGRRIGFSKLYSIAFIF